MGEGAEDVIVDIEDVIVDIDDADQRTHQNDYSSVPEHKRTHLQYFEIGEVRIEMQENDYVNHQLVCFHRYFAATAAAFLCCY